MFWHHVVDIPLEVQRATATSTPRIKDVDLVDPLTLTFGDLVDAALTVGTPNAADWVNHPDGVWEVSRRLVSLRARTSLKPPRVIGKSELLRHADATEKSFASYELGMACTLAFVRTHCGIADLAHFDLTTGIKKNTRPDLIEPLRKTFVAEAKGSVTKTSQDQMNRGVDQIRAAYRPRHRGTGVQYPTVNSGIAVCAGFEMADGRRPARLALHVQWMGQRNPIVPNSFAPRLNPARRLHGDALRSTYALVARWLLWRRARTLSQGSVSFLVARDPISDTWLGLDAEIVENARALSLPDDPPPPPPFDETPLPHVWHQGAEDPALLVHFGRSWDLDRGDDDRQRGRR